MSEQTDTPDVPRRLRAVDVIADQRSMIAQLLERGGGERSSVTLTRNAKGETQIEVIVRTDDETLTTADDAMKKARELYEAACTAYPAGTGFVRNEGQKP
jgi:hypothetical protein